MLDSLTQTGGHGDFRLDSQPTDYCECGPYRNVLPMHADGVDQCVRTVREELRKGASHSRLWLPEVYCHRATHWSDANILKRRFVRLSMSVVGRVPTYVRTVTPPLRSGDASNTASAR